MDMAVKQDLRREARRAADRATGILRGNLEKFTDHFQTSASVGQFYAQGPNEEWTTGFCTGAYWLAYELSGEEAFKNSALRQVDSFLRRIETLDGVDHHDMGFLYTPSCVAAYMLAGSETGKKAALLAADQLVSRFQEKGQFIQAWGALGAPDNYRLIIDCLLNLPLLYWAGGVTGDPKYRDTAMRHTKTSLQNLVREDSSTYHTFFFDPKTGAPTRGVTHQGYRDDSAWARGQAWGVYGTALSYRHTKDEECIRLFRRVADYFLAHLPQDKVPYWDLTFSDGDGEPRDSSAGAIAVCGMLEMSQYLPEDEAARYTEAAHEILLSLIERYAVRDPCVSNGLVLHGVYGKSSPYNTVRSIGVDECNTWGDYFYLEALARVVMDWKAYW